MTDSKIVAVGLLTERDLQTLGPTFLRAWPLDEAPCFTQLLDAIDAADRGVGLVKPDRGSQQGSASPTRNPIGEGRR